MTLSELLEINRELLPDEERVGLAFAELLWNNAGNPSDPPRLGRALEGILSSCQREGVRYPAILLRRKKELERGTWWPVGCSRGLPQSPPLRRRTP